MNNNILSSLLLIKLNVLLIRASEDSTFVHQFLKANLGTFEPSFTASPVQKYILRCLKIIFLTNLQMDITITRKDKPRPVTMMEKTTSQGIPFLSTSNLTMVSFPGMIFTSLVTSPTYIVCCHYNIINFGFSI